jgi:hypothetical protein
MGASHLTAGQRRWIYRLGAEGWSLREIAGEIGFSHQTVWGLLRKGSSRPARSGCWDPGPGRLSLAEREEISLGLHRGESFTALAGKLGACRVQCVRGKSRAPGVATVVGLATLTKVPTSGLADPSARSWRLARGLLLKSKPGWSSAGHPHRSPAGCAGSIPVIR